MSKDTRSRSEILKETADLAGAGGEIPDWMYERYYRHVAEDDLADLGAGQLAGMITSHRALAEERPERTAKARIFRPSQDADGWHCSYAVLQIVTDDMPFLVDSVTAELTRHDRDVHLIVHPQLVVERDAAGHLEQVCDEDVAAGEKHSEVGRLDESWMHLQIDLSTDEDADRRLEQDLLRILEDVRDAVEDWPKMHAACLRVAADLEAEPPSSVPSWATDQTRDFLAWLADEHFAFLGYKEYVLETVDGEEALRSVPGTGLGLLRWDADASSESFSRLTGEARARAREPQLLILTKANSRSTVHRPAYLDYVGVKTFDDQGNVIGERRFLGLYGSAAYTEQVRNVPIVRERVKKVIDRAGFDAASHSGKDLLRVLETYPRDELFQTSSAQLYAIATKVLRLMERRQSSLFLRRDDYGRFVSAMVYIPRDRYNTAARLRMERILKDAFEADSVDYTTLVGESTLARIHYVLRMAKGRDIPDVDIEQLQEQLIAASQTWDERLTDAARLEGGDDAAARVHSLYTRSFGEAYKEDFSPRQGVADLRHLEALEEADDTRLTLYREPGADPRERRFKLFRRQPLMLTEVLPVFTHLGVQVTDERPYQMRMLHGGEAFVYDFGLLAPDPDDWGTSDGEAAEVRERFQEAFAATWEGRAESDRFNALVLRAGLSFRQVVHLRAVAGYLRQVGITFSQSYLAQALVANVDLARELAELFEVRFDPTRGDLAAREAAQAEVISRITAGLEKVSSLDEDRIVRAFMGVMTATLRTNAFRRPDGDWAISMKIDCAQVPGIPSPKPMFEIWVYSPRVEGVHLRFGKVARGGLRWSDRREDFRTEVLGLVKAQMVKNAVIVPTGSKGGFYAKQLPDPSDREAWQAEGVAAYRAFISGLLDVTDNLVAGEVVPPPDVVRHDPDDTYLVVAADKGTAKFSDIANGVAQDYEFWLDDAFASGGSAGYDHKGMGITARGAWESVKRHFRDMAVDCQSEDFTAVGIGDMSGDVFGNGMLLSEHTRLVAAFDHRHVFIDPDPAAATSFVERQRLFDLPRSSWDDYDRALISAGGGVWPRTAKSITLSPQAIQALGLPEGTGPLTPTEVIHAILLAPVDLFWNGGIGTYVKASGESNAEIGDRANDAIRVNGGELRVKVVGEGGNLGASQLGRIEAAQAGVRINTDAIDNSAGVDTSDHEVNIKILLTERMRAGELTLEQRNELLQSMTDEVAAMVLRDNYEQNTLLGNARAQYSTMLPVHERLMAWLEQRGELNRELEFLPSEIELQHRHEAGAGLTSPELAVLVAYAKLALKADLDGGALTEDPWFEQTLSDYFPGPLRERFGDHLSEHPLRRQIVVNSVVNSLVNRGGITFAYRAQEETGATPEQIARAFVVAREVFGLSDFVAQVDALDNQVPTSSQTALYLEFRRLLDRAVRWLLHARPSHLDVGAEIERFRPLIRELSPQVPELLRGDERDRWVRRTEELSAGGVPTELAQRAAALLDTFSLLDVIEQSHDSRDSGESPQTLAALYFTLSETLGIDRMLNAVSQLPRDDRWDALARGAVRDDLYAVLEQLTETVSAASSPEATPAERLAQWSRDNQGALDRGEQALAGIRRLEQPGLAPLSVALRTLRTVIRSGSAS